MEDPADRESGKGFAMVTADKTRGVKPNALEIRMRITFAGRVTLTVCLIVALWNTPFDDRNEAGGRFSGSVS